MNNEDMRVKLALEAEFPGNKVQRVHKGDVGIELSVTRPVPPGPMTVPEATDPVFDAMVRRARQLYG